MEYLASIPIRPVSLREVLDCLEPRRAAKFIQQDVPKRFALRVRLIENLRDWQEVPELVEMHRLLASWYESLRLVRRGPDGGLKEFTECIKDIKQQGNSSVALVAAGIHKLQRISGDEYSDETLDRWLDGFLLSRIGSNMLLDQYIACASKEDGGLARATGIVDRRCDAVGVCRKAAKYAAQLCQLQLGKSPVIHVEHYEAGQKGQRIESQCEFSYIPGYLRYIMIELLKNSSKALIDRAENDAEINNSPIHVIVCRDKRNLAIRVSDRAGGIPLEVGERIWSYLYGRAAKGNESTLPATPLAGYGVGLPLARLHAQYLGGTLNVASYPGYGTDASLRLPTVEADQIERVH